MLCPNCKTELIEVNGRYICSDCGKEVPENEVMTSDWGNSTPAAAGIYGATDAEAPEPETTPEVPVSEPESLPESQTVEQVLQDQADDATAVKPEVEKSPETVATESVEAVLQEQADTAAAANPMDVPPINLDIPEVEAEPQQTETQPATGFYTAPANEEEPVTTDTVAATEQPVVAPEVTAVEPEQIPQSADTVLPEPLPVNPTPDVQEIPVNVLAPEIPVPTEPAPEQPSPQQEVVKDMFEDVPAAPISDPNLYSNSFDETAGINQVVQPVAVATQTLSAEKRTNLLIIAVGAVLALCLIGGGTWAYIALNSKAKPYIDPIVDVPTAAWQELQVVDAGFKISFPGQPDKTEGTQTIGGLDTPVITESYTSDDAVYTAAYATVNASADKLPSFVDDLAKSQSLDVVTTKAGTYFTANAIDFTLGREAATYQGKIMLQGNTYILIMAGSSSGQTVDFSKFIKSFSFVTASTGDTTN